MTTCTELDLKLSILKVLQGHVGRNNPIKASRLAEMLDCPKTNTWVIREAIGDLIKQGSPILATTQSPEGYFLANTYQEVSDYCDSLKDRGIKIIIRRRDVKVAAQRYFTGQSKLL